MGYKLLNHFKKSSSWKPWVSKKIFSFSSVQCWIFPPSRFEKALSVLHFSQDKQLIRIELVCRSSIHETQAQWMSVYKHYDVNSWFNEWFAQKFILLLSHEWGPVRIWLVNVKLCVIMAEVTLWGFAVWNWNNCFCPSRDANCPRMRLAKPAALL